VQDGRGKGEKRWRNDPLPSSASPEALRNGSMAREKQLCPEELRPAWRIEKLEEIKKEEGMPLSFPLFFFFFSFSAARRPDPRECKQEVGERRLTVLLLFLLVFKDRERLFFHFSPAVGLYGILTVE